MTRWAFWSVVTPSSKGMHRTLIVVSSTNLSYGRGDGGVCSERQLKGHHSRFDAVLLTLRPPKASVFRSSWRSCLINKKEVR